MPEIDRVPTQKKYHNIVPPNDLLRIDYNKSISRYLLPDLTPYTSLLDFGLFQVQTSKLPTY
jgi:hypothetical protein